MFGLHLARRASFRTVVFGLVAASGVAQGTKIPWWAGTYEAAFAEAKERNVPVVFVFIQDGEEANERVVSGVFSDNDYRKAMRDVVPIVLSHDQHRLVNETIDGEVKAVCSKFGGCPCEAHKRLEMDARADFVGEEVKTPQHVFVLPTHEVVDRMIDVFPPAAYVDMIRKAQKKLGRGLGYEAYRAGKKALADVAKLLDAKEWTAALKAVKAVEASLKDTELGKKLDEKVARIHRAAEAAYGAAQAHEAKGDAYAAIVGFDDVARVFPGTPSEAAAKKDRDRVRNTPTGREAAKILAREERARPAFESAEKAVADKDYVRAQRDFERVKKTAEGTPLAAEADKRLGALKGDPDVRQILARAEREAAADAALRVADEAKKAGDAPRAKEAYADVVKRYAGTKAAAAAEKKLAELK